MAELNENLEDISQDSTIPPLRMTETGYNGLRVVGGIISEECNQELRWPRIIHTFKKMMKDGTIFPAIDYVQTMVARVPWTIEAPKGYEDELKDEIVFLNTVMNDMEHSWQSFIQQASSFVSMGFAVFEVVPRYRLNRKGSRYNDGLRGIRKLAFRSQDTIAGWKYANKGRDLSHIVQTVNIPSNRDGSYIQAFSRTDEGRSEVDIPIEKCLLFRNNPDKDSPEGKSPLIGCWEAWKYKKAYEKTESTGVAQDMQGFKVLYIPPQYMREDASDEDKSIYEYYQKMMMNAHVGKQSGFILPNMTDPNSSKGEGLFKFDVVSVSGSKSYDVNKIISRYQKEILTALYADFLIVGQDGGGSFAMSDSKMSIARMVIESKLSEIRDVLNHKLIPMIFKWNGWSPEVYPRFEFGDISELDLDTFSKAIQRAAAVGMVAKTALNVNAIAERLDLPERLAEDMSLEEVLKYVGDPSTRSGDGMKGGMGNGTGNSTGGSGDSSTSNNENA